MRTQVLHELRWLVQASRAPRIRPILQWAEEEFVIPEGAREGTRFRASTLPWQALWLREIDSGHWNRFIMIACVQGGKTLVGWVLPIMWHLFEWRESVLAGVVQMEMSGLKWRKELLPAINANPKFRALLREHGKGSRGGQFESLTFSHGPDITFLSGKGGDEKRSGITSRIVAVTEADRVDDAGEASDEAAPIYQMEARLASFGNDARFFAECTRTTATGFVSREYEAGTASRIMCPCPHCGDWVSPEREDLVGWEDAQSELAAGEESAFYCPACREEITELERRLMNEDGRLVHRGQAIDRAGQIHGERPPTKTLGFRANAFNNLLWSPGFIGAQEWRAKRDRDTESAERKLRQFYWALPIEPNEFNPTPLSADDILAANTPALTRGIVPPGTMHLAGAADLRKTQLHFGVVAFARDPKDNVVRRHFIDIGVIPVPSAELGPRKALLAALRTLRDKHIEPGYVERESGKVWRPGWFSVDAFWFTPVVRQFIRECRTKNIKRYIPSFGRGLSAEHSRGRYQQPEKETKEKPFVGENFYVSWHDKHALHALVVSADAWKTEVREGFATPADQPGTIRLFEATTEDEQKLQRQFAKEVAAERAYWVHVPERGQVLCYANDNNRPNHFGDVAYNALACLWLCGARITESPRVAVARQPAPSTAMTMPDGRPYFITSRDQ
jgi:hypothetical protein